MKPSGAKRVAVLLLFWSCCGLNICDIIAEDDGVVSRTKRSEPLGQYCPYFKNRGPSKQDNLRNCSWYSENSCCHDEEIDSAFRQLTPLVSASGDCNQHLNYLYCYICAPNQNTFFKDFTLTVCEEFCDRVYSACKNALLKGRKIRNVYKNGKEFCKGRRFETDKEANGRCFTFVEKPGVKSIAERTAVNSLSIMLGLFTIFTKHCVLF